MRTMRIGIIPLLLACLLYGKPAEADVCFGGFSPAEHVAQADVIVAAKLVKVTEQEQPPQSGRVYRTYQFLVEKVYKGPIRPGESVQDAMPTDLKGWGGPLPGAGPYLLFLQAREGQYRVMGDASCVHRHWPMTNGMPREFAWSLGMGRWLKPAAGVALGGLLIAGAVWWLKRR